MIQEVNSAEGSINADYYYNEEGSGYIVMDIAGQHIETEWTK